MSGTPELCFAGKGQLSSSPLTMKPSSEREAIETKGGFLPGDVARVDGQLAVARAFGDKTLKEHLNSDPDVKAERISDDDELLILASDGLWKLLASMWAAVPQQHVEEMQTSRARTERLWKEYLRDPSQWCDNRTSKTNPSAPDLQHKLTRESLWMDGSCNPSWVHDRLMQEGMHTPYEKQVKNSTGDRCRMLSLEEALPSLEEVLLPQPSLEDLAHILDNCKKDRNRAHGLCLDAHMHKSGLEAHRSLVGNYLLAEVGSMQDAQQVLDRLVIRNELSWNSLIIGFTKIGKPQHALTLYQKMQKDDSVHLNGHTFVALLKACAKLKDLETGLKIHAEIDRTGLLERNVFVGSTLVDMYAKCSSLAEAQKLFDKLPVRNVVSWTALIAGYAEHGNGEEALNCFEQMQLEGVSPNSVTFVCSLKACGSIGATQKGQEIHAEIERQGLLQRDLVVGNALVDMYAKSGSLTIAQQVFDKLPVRNTVSWNSLIAGYADYGHGEEALNCFEQMQLEGVSPDAVTFICSLKACGSIGATDQGRDIHVEIERHGLLERDLVVGNTLVDMYAKCGSLAIAQQVFDKLSVRDVVSWTVLISGYAEHGHGEKALKCFEQMQLEGVSPDAVTFVWSLKACGNIGATEKGREIHTETERQGLLEGDILVGNTVVDMYAKCGWLAIAHQVFDQLPVRNRVSWNALIGGYVEQGNGEEALKCFEQMRLEGVSPDVVTFICSLKACGSTGATGKGREIHAEIERQGLLERDVVVGNTLVDMYAKCGSLAIAQEVCDKLPIRNVVSWTTLIAGYAEHGRGEEALKCFEQMQLEGVFPNAVTLVCSLKACGSIGAKGKGREIHTEIERQGLLEIDLVVGNTLVDMYAKCGSLTIAQQVFDKLPVRDIVAWTALMAGYAQLGESENVFHTYDKMLGGGVKPNPVTFVVVLNACSRTGLFSKSQTYFETMSKDFGFAPSLEHHACVIDLLGRAGQLDKAAAMIKKIPFFPNLVVWHTVLGACRNWGNVVFGKQAFEHAVCLDDKDSVAYVLLSHIYAGAELQKEANKVEAIRLEEAKTLLVD